MEANVLIRKHKIRLRISDEQLALRMRKLLNDTLQHDLKSMMERVFDQNASSELYINIDKLYIDLGVLSVDEFERQFIKLAESKLVNELQKQLKDYMEPVYTTAQQQYDFYNDNHVAAPFLQLNPVREQELTALVFFLEQGIYPWWYPKTDQKSPTQLLGFASEDDRQVLLLKLISLHKKKSPDVFNRIILRLFNHLPQSEYTSLINSLTGLYNEMKLSNNIQESIKNAGQLAAIFSIPLREFYRHLFSFILGHDEMTVDNFMLNFFRKVIVDEKLTVGELRKNQKSYSLEPELKEILGQISSQNVKLSDATQQKEDTAKIMEQGIKGPSDQKNDVLPDQGIYIGNAGLLLLNPFLQYLFSDAGLLTESNQFISDAEQYKATVLLNYLQSGNTEYKEWEMALNKILCGLDHQAVLPDDITLSEDDKQNCDNLLKAVIQHWEALKGAGLDALRNTFLLREGKISHKENHWLVQVERTGTDILLDRLPWGFSTIKLPWLDQLIHTEW